MRIQAIINSARLTLADKSSQRYTDEDLLVYLNQGLVDFCQRTEMLHCKEKVYIHENEAYFDLSPETYKVTRVLFEDKVLAMYSHQEIDSVSVISDYRDFVINYDHSSSAKWELKKGIPEVFLWDMRNPLQGKLYPIPKEELFLANMSGLFGVYSEGGFGVSDQGFGVITSVVKPIYVTVYYIKNHSLITSVDDTLEIPAMYDTAMMYYITAQAFLSNLDNQYIEKSRLQFQLYENILRRALTDAAADWTRASQLRTSYRRGV